MNLFIPVSSRLGCTVVLATLEETCALKPHTYIERFCLQNPPTNLVIRVTVALPFITQEPPLLTAATEERQVWSVKNIESSPLFLFKLK